MIQKISSRTPQKGEPEQSSPRLVGPRNAKPSGSPSSTGGSLTKVGDTYTFTSGVVTYTLLDYTPQPIHKQNLTLKCQLTETPTQFYLDELKLYRYSSRKRYIDGLLSELASSNTPAVNEEKIRRDLKTLSTLLEKENSLTQAPESPEATPKPTIAPTDYKIAEAALKHPNLISNMLSDLEKTGFVGDDAAKALCAVATVSRFLDTPLGILIISRSGAGKTMLQNTVCSMVNEEDLAKYTRISETTLFYQGENALKRKVLAIEEEDGMKNAIYSIRTLQSSQKLAVSTTGSDPKTGKLKAEQYTVEGPVFIIISTTNPDAMDAETRSRFIIVTIDESEEQTKRIQNARRKKYTLDGRMAEVKKKKIFKKYQNMQRLLKPLEVSNPWAEVLEYPFDRLAMRRDFDKYMVLISSIALFHQYQRPIRKMKDGEDIIQYIEVKPSDIALANQLVLKYFPYSTDDMAPHTRNFAEEIHKYLKQTEATKFTRKEIRDFTGWGDWSVRQALEQLVALGYLTRSGYNGVANVYEVLVDAIQERRREFFLTDVKGLKSKLKELEEQKQKEQSKFLESVNLETGEVVENA